MYFNIMEIWLGFLIGKFRHFLTELSARHTIVAGYYRFTFSFIYIQSTLVISNFTGPDKNVRVISSSRQPNCDVIGMTTVRLSVRQNVVGRHMYMAI